MPISMDKKSSLQLSIEAELVVMQGGTPVPVAGDLESNAAEQELSDALGADDFVSKVAGEEPEGDKELLDEFNDSLGGSGEGMLADALEEEADSDEEEKEVEPEASQEASFDGLEKPSVDDITAESLEEDAFDAAAHEELSIEDDVHEFHEEHAEEEQPAATSSAPADPEGPWAKSSLQLEIEEELGFSSAPIQTAELEPIPEPEPEPIPEPLTQSAASPDAAAPGNEAEASSNNFDRKPLWEGSDAVNAADYDDQELETIMDEIEDLERKYRENADWEGETLEIDSNKKKMTDLQRSIEDDINAAKVNESLEVQKPKPVQPLAMDAPSSDGLALSQPDPVSPLAMDSGGDSSSLALKGPAPIEPLSMDSGSGGAPKVSQPAPSSRPAPSSLARDLGSSEMSFSAAGTMNFNMDFNVGSKIAHLNVSGQEGLICSMDDYKVIIKEGLGFILEMPGGARLTIPVDNPGSNQKKKVG